MPRLFFTVGLIASLVADAASVARAAEALADSYVVDIEVDAPPSVVLRVRAVSTEVLQRLDVTPIVRGESTHSSGERRRAPPPLAYAYIDLEAPTLPRLVVVDGATQRELARRTLPETASLETSIEAVTLVLYMTLESLISEADAGVNSGIAPANSPARPASVPRRGTWSAADASAPRAAEAGQPESTTRSPATAPESATRSPATPEHDATEGAAAGERDGLAVDIGAFLRVMTLDNATALAGGGAAIEVRAERLTPRLGALLFAAAHASEDLSFEGASVKLTPFSARLLPTLSVPLAPRISALIGLGAGIDWLRTDVHDAPASAQGGGTSSTMDATVSALLGTRAQFSRYLSMNFSAALDLDASPRAFVVRIGGERRALLEVSRLRPSVLLGFALSPTGVGP